MTNPLEHFKRLMPKKATGRVKELVNGTFMAFNSARLREACHLFVEKFV